jgi:hypothetical protein
MASRGQLVVRFAGDTRDLGKATKRAQSSLSKFGGVAKKMAKIAAVGATAAAAGAVVVGKALFDASETAGTSNARIEQVFKSMNQFGGGATKAASRVTKLSDTMARQTGIDQNVIKSGAAVLGTFSNISKSADKVGGTFDKTLGLATDLSAAGFGSVESASQMLGKALQDPTKGLTALRRVGVTFTEGQQKQIKAMQEAGNVAGAQKVILKGVQGQVGGVAKATANASDQIRVGFSQIVEKVGLKLVPVFKMLTDFALNVLLPAFEKHVSPALVKLGNWMGDDGVMAARKLVAGFKDVVARVKDVVGWIVKNRDWLSALAVAVGAGVAAWQLYVFVTKGIPAIMLAMKGAMIAAAGAQKALNLAMKANPIGLVITAIAALVAGLVWFFTKTKTGQKIVKAAWSGIKKAMSAVSTWWTKTAWPAIKAAIKAMGDWFGKVGRAVGRVWRAMGDGIGRVWKWIKRNVIDRFVLGLKVLRLAFLLARDRVSSAFGKMRDRLARIGAWIREKVFGRMRDGLHRMRDGFRNAKDGIGRIWEGLRKLAARPINFVLGTVYNKGIRKWVGKIFDFFGKSNPLPEAKLVKFAKGSEDHRAQIARAGAMRLWAEPETGGEAYIPLAGSKRPRSTAILAKVASRFGYGLQKYADGGFSFGLSDALKFAGDTGGWLKDKLSGFATAKFGTGRTGGIWDMLREIPGTIIRNMGGWAKSQLGNLFGGLFGGAGGTYDGKAAAGMGWRAMWDAVRGAFPSASLNSAFRPGAITAVGTPSLHGLGRAIDVTPSMKIFDWLAKNFPFSTELIYSPAGARQLYKGRRTLFGEPTRGDHWDHIHWAMKNGGMLNKVPTFDNGGTLGRGLNLVNNATGAPEHLGRADREQRVVLEIKSSGRDVDDMLLKILRRSIKNVSGGNVQMALGRQ